MKIENIKKDFPILKNRDIVYLDNRSNHTKTNTSATSH